MLIADYSLKKRKVHIIKAQHRIYTDQTKKLSVLLQDKVSAGVYTSQNKQTDLGTSQGRVLYMNLFQVAINMIGNGVDGSLFVENLAMYITTRN